MAGETENRKHTLGYIVVAPPRPKTPSRYVYYRNKREAAGETGQSFVLFLNVFFEVGASARGLYIFPAPKPGLPKWGSYLCRKSFLRLAALYFVIFPGLFDLLFSFFRNVFFCPLLLVLLNCVWRGVCAQIEVYKCSPHLVSSPHILFDASVDSDVGTSTNV